MSGTLVTNEGGVARRLLHVLRVLVRHGFLRTLLGRPASRWRYWLVSRG